MQNQKEELIAKLKLIYPEIDKYGLQMQLDFDAQKNAWIASFSKDNHNLSTHLDEKDVQSCLQGSECYHLGIQLGQFIRNYCEGGQECTLGQDSPQKQSEEEACEKPFDPESQRISDQDDACDDGRSGKL